MLLSHFQNVSRSMFATVILPRQTLLCCSSLSRPLTAHRLQVRRVGSTPDPERSSVPLLSLKYHAEEDQQSALRKITREDFERDLYPLLCHGWKLNTGPDKSLSLTRKFVFKGPVSARKFLVKLLEVEENLGHHTNSMHLNSDKRPILTLTTLTHDLAHPWISPQDIRLAFELERFYRNGAFSPTKGRLAIQSPSHLAEEYWAELLKAYPWDNYGARIVDNIYQGSDP
ncbi:hypothetical protein HYPSUDRAFT_34719 [Hypholoma sublateritium FD-334 SS-4]|uniref:4a-hydroxytetrahydrobiopterin dehydratase n=1 Tax=Hypholoma sublateritium (strain FD-334 SS-4) TaxID=945553 RepID=A0A0D2P9M6_HYPSF|nr:hypothetical protein HYPSUDRAFT_34719 [Hypholoma sublateritium FD-334 SS-4]